MKTKRDYGSKHSPSPAPSKRRAASPDGSMAEGSGSHKKKRRATPEFTDSSDDCLVNTREDAVSH